MHAAVATAQAELDSMRCEAFFMLMCMEWPAMGQAIKRTVLRATSDAFMGGLHT